MCRSVGVLRTIDEEWGGVRWYEEEWWEGKRSEEELGGVRSGKEDLIRKRRSEEEWKGVRVTKGELWISLWQMICLLDNWYHTREQYKFPISLLFIRLVILPSFGKNPNHLKRNVGSQPLYIVYVVHHKEFNLEEVVSIRYVCNLLDTSFSKCAPSEQGVRRS